MKKFFSSLCAFAIICLLAFSGCSDGWTEVQSITYHTDSGSKTLTSTIVRDITDERIEKSEYENAPTEQKKGSFIDDRLEETIAIKRKDFLATVKKEMGKTYFSSYTYNGPEIPVTRNYYHKYTINSVQLCYVKVKISDNGNIEIKYYEHSTFKSLRIAPTSYEITYFED